MHDGHRLAGYNVEPIAPWVIALLDNQGAAVMQAKRLRELVVNDNSDARLWIYCTLGQLLAVGRKPPAPSLALSLLPVIFEFAMKVRFPPGFKSLFSLALLVHVAGGISRFYWKFAPFYDKIAHVCSALALFLLIISVFAFLDYYGTTLKWRTVLIGTVALVSILMIAWEISEYVIDLIATTSYNNGIIDSIGDVIANIIGITIGYSIVRYYRTLIPAGKTLGQLLAL